LKRLGAAEAAVARTQGGNDPRAVELGRLRFATFTDDGVKTPKAARRCPPSAMARPS
jgi:hypothetical protein